MGVRTGDGCSPQHTLLVEADTTLETYNVIVLETLVHSLPQCLVEGSVGRGRGRTHGR